MAKSSWNDKRDQTLRQLFYAGLSQRAIAERMGIYHATVATRIEQLELTRGSKPDEPAPSPSAARSQVQAHKHARRGFVVPPDLERRYADLLKTGISIAEACRQLGIPRTNRDQGL